MIVAALTLLHTVKLTKGFTIGADRHSQDRLLRGRPR